MPPKSRKRFSAFDDFPAEQIDSLVTGAVETGNPEHPLPSLQQTPATQVERIERLKPSQMIPDRFQPRRLLPAHLRQAFFSGELDCYQTAAEWLALTHSDSGYKAEVERLLHMGSSFEEHGQIKPITGTWQTAANGSFIFQIETGERRFWAACLQHVVQKSKEEPLLRVEVVSHPTRQRQVLENRHAEAPSAVEQACEVASLILAELAIQPNEQVEDDYEYFRQARSQRMPAGLWDQLIPIMQLSRPRMVQLLNILQLPSSQLELADRYRLPERVLREILLLPRENWERLIRSSIQNSLTSEEVSEQVLHPEKGTAGKNAETTPQPPVRMASRGLKRFWQAFDHLDKMSQTQTFDELADELFSNGQAERILPLLDKLSSLLQARIKRK